MTIQTFFCSPIYIIFHSLELCGHIEGSENIFNISRLTSIYPVHRFNQTYNYIPPNLTHPLPPPDRNFPRAVVPRFPPVYPFSSSRRAIVGMVSIMDESPPPATWEFPLPLQPPGSRQWADNYPSRDSLVVVDTIENWVAVLAHDRLYNNANIVFVDLSHM